MSKHIYYPDGTCYAKLQGTPARFVHRLNTYEDLWKLNQILDVYKHKGEPKPTVIIPCLIDAQADRRFNENESHNLKLILNFLNNLHAKYVIWHPHNPEVVEALLDDVVILTNKDFVNQVISKIKSDSLILMSSDAGGFKPLMKLCDSIQWKGETYSANKSRTYTEEGSKLIQIVDRTDFKGKDILIIDDICVKGGTFIGLSKLLRQRNAGKLYLAVTHLTLPFISKELASSFDLIFTTNSKGFDKYESYTQTGQDKIYPIKTENLIIL